MGERQGRTQRALHNEEKQVRERKVVDRDDGGGVMGDLLHVSALHKTLWLLQTLWATAFIATKQQGVKGLEEVFWGVRQCVQAS